MLRALLAALLLANLVFLGWASGWFAPAWPAPGAGEREPRRLVAQVAPERITVLTPAAASAALAAAKKAVACAPAGAGSQNAASASASTSASAPALAASQPGDLKPCEPGA